MEKNGTEIAFFPNNVCITIKCKIRIVCSDKLTKIHLLPFLCRNKGSNLFCDNNIPIPSIRFLRYLLLLPQQIQYDFEISRPCGKDTDVSFGSSEANGKIILAEEPEAGVIIGPGKQPVKEI